MPIHEPIAAELKGPERRRGDRTWPRRALRRFLRSRAARVPVALYQAHLGWLFGRRLLLLVHRGRRTHLLRRTVLEVVAWHEVDQEAVVVSGLGSGAQWYQNVLAGKAIEIRIARLRFAPSVRRLDTDEAVRTIADFERRNRMIAPVIRAGFSALGGFRYDGSDAARRRLVEALPLVGFRPRDRAKPDAQAILATPDRLVPDAPTRPSRPRPLTMHPNPKGSTPMSRQLMIPVADTRLYAVDAPGGTPALLFLSGGFGTVRNWSRVIRRLDGKYRTVRFDARARGKSGRSADYSVQAAVDDIGRVIDATGIERPILVGWSHGATIAVRYAAQHPGRVRGLVLVDGAYPIAMFDEAGKQKVRTQFRRLGWIMRILAALGRSARMSPAESADVVIEMDAVNGELGPDFAALECPTVFVVGTGAHSGATEDEMRTVRAAAADAEESNKRVSVFATTPHKHTQILNKAPDTVVAAIEDVIHESS